LLESSREETPLRPLQAFSASSVLSTVAALGPRRARKRR